jgi:hypothetical protein
MEELGWSTDIERRGFYQKRTNRVTSFSAVFALLARGNQGAWRAEFDRPEMPQLPCEISTVRRAWSSSGAVRDVDCDARPRNRRPDHRLVGPFAPGAPLLH